MSLTICNLDCSSSYLPISARDCTFDSCKYPKAFQLFVTMNNNYLSDLYRSGISPLVVTMSLSQLQQIAIAFLQHFQNLFRVKFRCLDRWLSWLAITSSLLSSLRTGSGKLIIHWPIKRCDGVSGSLKSSVKTYVSGQELSTISTSVRAVSSSS